jgi:glycine amidinotransferase
MNIKNTSNTSFGTLKSLIVGSETKFSKIQSDFTFKYFYQPALNQEIYDNKLKYKISHELADQRNEELNNMAETFKKLGLEVHRPNDYTKPIKFITPEYGPSIVSPANNVRDISLIYNGHIIETPTFVRDRFFENAQLEQIFKKKWIESNYSLKWIKAPYQVLVEETMDLQHWNIKRDFTMNNLSSYSMAIDGAQFLRIGKDVIVNITSYNHWIGLKWIKSFFPDTNFHIISLVDNHIDGLITCLRPGLFLVNPNYQNIRDHLPKKFQNWDIIFPEKSTRQEQSGASLASIDGMDVNILSIDSKTVAVKNNSYQVLNLLEKHNFNIIPIELNHCELFGGGIHCSTLDLERDDDYIDYTK